MKPKNNFIHDNFLLENKFAEELYHGHARDLPIIDYHCHLSPKDIAEDTIFENITKVWIYGDHYKWRAMRTLGINEQFITGDASDQDKFLNWASAVPYTVRNPLYHWTHMELARYFNINELLTKDSAPKIYQQTAEKLSSSTYSCRNLISRMNVETICTTEDPTDDLAHHQSIAKSNFKTKISTAFRPDKAFFIDSETYLAYVNSLATIADVNINSYENLCEALRARMEYFHQNGCRVSDHGLESIPAVDFTQEEVSKIFQKRLEGQSVSAHETQKFQSAVLIYLAEQYHRLGWVQQFHLGALRNNNSRMNAQLGPDTGWDSVGDFPQARTLSKFLNALDSRDRLTKTILYNLNPADNEVLATMIGNFNDGSIKGKVQFGSAWWFLDQKDGIEKQINALSNMGLISCFLGMLTDSRSFLSYPRHEYFRRVLCNLFGKEIQTGELPQDIPWLGKINSDICYHNAKAYFDF